MNSIDAAELTYPDKPDKNGYAKRYYKRRAYYFGTHNSPESFLLFGEWKRQLIETGAAPEVKAIRKDLAHRTTATAAESPTIERRSHLWPWISLLGAFIVSGTMLGSVKILSSNLGPTVDGVTLTDEELEVIRGLRMHAARLEQIAQGNSERTTEILQELMEEGPKDVNPHRKQGT